MRMVVPSRAPGTAAQPVVPAGKAPRSSSVGIVELKRQSSSEKLEHYPLVPEAERPSMALHFPSARGVMGDSLEQRRAKRNKKIREMSKADREFHTSEAFYDEVAKYAREMNEHRFEDDGTSSEMLRMFEAERSKIIQRSRMLIDNEEHRSDRFTLSVDALSSNPSMASVRPSKARASVVLPSVSNVTITPLQARQPAARPSAVRGSTVARAGKVVAEDSLRPQEDYFQPTPESSSIGLPQKTAFRASLPTWRQSYGMSAPKKSKAAVSRESRDDDWDPFGRDPKDLENKITAASEQRARSRLKSDLQAEFKDHGRVLASIDGFVKRATVVT